MTLTAKNVFFDFSSAVNTIYEVRIFFITIHLLESVDKLHKKTGRRILESCGRRRALTHVKKVAQQHSSAMRFELSEVALCFVVKWLKNNKDEQHLANTMLRLLLWNRHQPD